MQTESFAFHIAICDDNVGDRKQMERLLKRESDKRAKDNNVLYVDSYGSIPAIMRSPMIYDAFYIDMASGETDGAALALLLREAGVTAPIVLCVSSVDYRELFCAYSEVERRNIFFLDKPIKKEELSASIDQISALKNQIMPTIELRGETITRYVEEDDIVYAKVDGRYIHVYLKDGSIISILSSITNLYSQLAAYTHYAAVSRSSMVNVIYLKKVSLTKLTLTNGTVIRTSPSYSMDIKKALRQSAEEL
jgi:DNA-binding LytR/AlgR family response regulator